MAEKAGLEIVKGAVFKVKGIGDGEAQSSLAYIAQDLRIGGIAFADYRFPPSSRRNPQMSTALLA